MSNSPNFTKTFKSEYLSFGECTVRKIGGVLLVTFGEDQVVWTARIKTTPISWVRQYLEANASSYWAEKITNYINQKITK